MGSDELDIALSRDAKILDLRSYSSAAKSARRDEGVETPYFQSHTALRCTLREQRARDIQRQNEAINAQKSQSLITSRFSGSFAFPTSPVARNFKDSSQPESPSNPTIDPPKEEKPRETITADELDSIRNKAKSMEEHLQYMTRACAYFLDPNEKHSADDKTLFSKYESWFSFSFGTGFTGMILAVSEDGSIVVADLQDGPDGEALLAKASGKIRIGDEVLAINHNFLKRHGTPTLQLVAHEFKYSPRPVTVLFGRLKQMPKVLSKIPKSNPSTPRKPSSPRLLNVGSATGFFSR